MITKTTIVKVMFIVRESIDDGPEQERKVLVPASWLSGLDDLGVAVEDSGESNIGEISTVPVLDYIMGEY